jgi:hypothetical protein
MAVQVLHPTGLLRLVAFVVLLRMAVAHRWHHNNNNGHNNNGGGGAGAGSGTGAGAATGAAPARSSFTGGSWSQAHATYYGGADASGTQGVL